MNASNIHLGPYEAISSYNIHEWNSIFLGPDI